MDGKGLGLTPQKCNGPFLRGRKELQITSYQDQRSRPALHFSVASTKDMASLQQAQHVSETKTLVNKLKLRI